MTDSDYDVEIPPPSDFDPNDPTTGMELRRPSIPVTVSELAARKGEALEIIEARVKILETVRLAALKATHPEDWVLFKSPDDQGGQIIGYLQDAGCDRVRDLFGINVLNVSEPQKQETNDPKVFHYTQYGDGLSTLTRQRVERMEGGRSSTDDFCRGKVGVDLILAVRKATRANLDGNITRELAGLKSVPLDEIKLAWTGTTKTVERCRKGRGFGTREERAGGERVDAPQIPPPVCPHCGTTGVYRSSARGGFYGCPQYKTHEDRKWTVDAKKWEEEYAKRPPPAAQPATAAAGPHTQQNGTPTKSVNQGDIKW